MISNIPVQRFLGMENNGVKIDQKMLVDYSKELSKRLEKLVNKAFSLSGEEFNLDSPKQLLEILFNKLNLPVLKKTPKDNLQLMRRHCRN